MSNESPQWLQSLRDSFTAEQLHTDAHHLHTFSYDASFGRYLPQAVLQLQNAQEIARLMKFANEHKVPVTPRGLSTSLSGGPLPVQGGIVLDMSRMTEKLLVDAKDLVAEVSAGVITSDIHQAAEQVGLMYPPDPSSAHVSTIGGNLAENSGGPRGLKYGVTKDYVLGLKIVTPEGKIVNTGGRTMKNVTGYDLTRLIVGSEGTLAIITEATLRLIPRPAATKTIMAVFHDLVTAGNAISEILISSIVPAKIEIMDQACIAAVEAYNPSGLPLDAEAILLIELDGHPAAIEDEALIVERVCHKHHASQVVAARDQAEADRLWLARKQVSPAIIQIKPTKISEDITVPISRIPEAFARLKQIREKYNLALVVFGHAGDGNLHPNIMCDQRDKQEMKKVEQAVSDIFSMAVELGGTLSGEHGIGLMKASFMEMECGVEGVELMKQLKKAWDPHNILNPGKIFPSPGQKLNLSDD